MVKTWERTLELFEEEDSYFSEAELDRGLAVALAKDSRFNVDWPNPETEFRYCLRSRGWIGHIPVDSCLVTVQPKVPVGNIFGMLEIAYNLKTFRLFEGETAVKTIDELFERIVSILADRINDRVRRGLYREYVEKSEDLAYVRGRIDIRGNIANVLRNDPALRCRFEELTADLEENQILLYALHLASRIRLTRLDVAQKVRRAYRALVGTVQLTEFKAQDCINRFYNRLNDDYRPIHGLCRLIFEHAGPTVERGGSAFLPFALNMPVLFESFVAKWLQGHVPPEFRVREQFTTRLKANAEMSFRIDIVIEEKASRKPLLVLDAKYKDAVLPQESDVQQVVAYAVERGVTGAALVFPKALASPFSAQIGPISVEAISYNLAGVLEESGEAFLRKMLSTIDRERRMYSSNEYS